MFPFSRDHLKLSVWAQIFKIKWVLPEGELASIIKKLIGTPVFKVFHLSNSWVQLIIKIWCSLLGYLRRFILKLFCMDFLRRLLLPSLSHEVSRLWPDLALGELLFLLLILLRNQIKRRAVKTELRWVLLKAIGLKRPCYWGGWYRPNSHLGVLLLNPIKIVNEPPVFASGSLHRRRTFIRLSSLRDPCHSASLESFCTFLCLSEHLLNSLGLALFRASACRSLLLLF
jgi:hypothetical protein